jgi:xylulokinase
LAKICLIGVDIGTQGTKAAVYTPDGKTLASAFRPSRLHSPAPGVVEQDPEEMFAEFTGAVREAVEKAGVRPSFVAAIGIDGQMAGVLGIDRDWNAVTHYDSWLDTRCGKYIEHIKKTAEDLVIRTTGCPVVGAHGPRMLWWKHERPEAWGRIARFVMPTAYIAGRLCGLKAENAWIDYTQIHFSGFADVERKAWSSELIRLFGMDGAKLPRIAEPWAIVGGLTHDAAEALGLAPGTPVAAGCGDQAATSLGAGVTRPGLVFDVAGTASVFSCCVEKYTPDVQNKTILFARSVIDGLWVPLAYISGGGLCLKWFRDGVCGGAYSYDELNEQAATVRPGSEGLMFVPHFGGRTCPNDPAIRGSWLGLGWIHERRHMYRSILESIAYEYSYYYKLIRGLMIGPEAPRVIAIGGGAKSRLFSSIKADVLGIPYEPHALGDTATWGSAVVAGYGAGVFADIANALTATAESGLEPVPPDMENHGRYAALAAAYEALFGPLNRLYSALGKPGEAK